MRAINMTRKEYIKERNELSKQYREYEDKNTTPVMATMEEMDNYIDNIKYRVETGRIPPSEMIIVERYKEYRKQNRAFREVDFKKLMRHLMGKDTVVKTNIIKYEVDTRKLQEEISKYEIMNNQKAYLMMNKETMDTITLDIAEKCKPLISPNDVKDLGGKLSTYHGNKCYVDNDLAFGEVEIR